LNSSNIFRQALRRGRQGWRSERFRNRPGLEPFEDRVVPSTLSGDALGNAHHLASSGVANNLTLSERIVPLAAPSPSGTSAPVRFLVEDVITDTSETIGWGKIGTERKIGT
jgi:hypothetical protein